MVHLPRVLSCTAVEGTPQSYLLFYTIFIGTLSSYSTCAVRVGTIITNKTAVLMLHHDQLVSYSTSHYRVGAIICYVPGRALQKLAPNHYCVAADIRLQETGVQVHHDRTARVRRL